jgi:hypothetical protein
MAQKELWQLQYGIAEKLAAVVWLTEFLDRISGNSLQKSPSTRE